MWSCVDIEAGKLENFDITIKHLNEVKCKAIDTCIKEIIVIYSDYNSISFDKHYVPLAIEYDTEFGLHVILFSEVINLQYVNEYLSGIETYTSNKMWHTAANLKLREVIDDGEYLKEEKLTLMFKEMLSILRKKDKIAKQNNIDTLQEKINICKKKSNQAKLVFYFLISILND